MPLYATPAQLATYLTGEPTSPPANSGVLLRRASSLVAHAIRGAIYQATLEGLPARADLLAATVEATCAQAAAWHGPGIDPTQGRAGLAATASSKSLGGASVTYTVNPADVAARGDLASGDVLVGEAWRVLDRAGLLSTGVQSSTQSAPPAPLEVVTGNPAAQWQIVP